MKQVQIVTLLNDKVEVWLTTESKSQLIETTQHLLNGVREDMLNEFYVINEDASKIIPLLKVAEILGIKKTK